jgi:hypothetical protein
MQKIRSSLLSSAVLTAFPLALPPVAAAQTCVQPGSGLVSWWQFEGDANDFQGLNPGIVSGGQFLPAHVGLGYESGGGFVEVAHDPSLVLSELTIEAWVRLDAIGSKNQVIIWKGDNGGADVSTPYAIGVRKHTGIPFVFLSNGSSQLIDASVALPFGVFTHLAVTVGSDVRIYIDGQLDTVAPLLVPPPFINTTYPIRFGSLLGGHVLAGAIDEMSLYDRALAQSEIQAIFAAGMAGKCTVVDSPPVAVAAGPASVDEGALSVALDGSASSDPDGDPLTFAWIQLAGTPVMLIGANTAAPTFDAPTVPLGGETLSFELTVTANGLSAMGTVDVTVVNVNHPPVADAGGDQTIAEGSLVTLHGEDSFDIDNDPFTYAWSQASGPVVTLSDANVQMPTFTAPLVASGTTATLVFLLTVDDGFPPDAPAPGYTLQHVVDSVSVDVTNLNNDPVAHAGADQTKDENTPVSLSGVLSMDPDGDTLSYAWLQVGGLIVTLTGEFTATPSFTAPFVSSGGEDLTFELQVTDGFGGIATDTTVVHLLNANDPPLVSAAAPTCDLLWPPTHKLVSIGITGVSDPNDNATITIDSVTQDEPTNGLGDGDTAIDAILNGDGTLFLRAERSGQGDGRVYHIHFTASDLEGNASGVVTVTVPHRKNSAAVDGGELYDSTH